MVTRGAGGSQAVGDNACCLASACRQPVSSSTQSCTMGVLLVSCFSRHLMSLRILQIEEGLCQLMAMLWLDSQDRWAKTHDAKARGTYQETLLSYLGYQIRTDTSEVGAELLQLVLHLTAL